MRKWGFFLPAIVSVAVVGCSTTSEQPTDRVDTSKVEKTQTENKVEIQPVVKPEPKLSPIEKNPSVKSTPIPKVKPKQPAKPKTVTAGEKSADGKLILGQKEWVYIESLDVNVVARVDTGATTSSASAIDIVSFERDGKKWVKFKLAHGDRESKQQEMPVVSTKFIRQSNSDKTYERYVVEGWVKVGDLKVKTPFTLADRTHMDYGLLLGRSFFRDVAIVDVSREFVQPKAKLDKL